MPALCHGGVDAAVTVEQVRVVWGVIGERGVEALLRPGGLECLPYAVVLSMCPAAPGRLLRHLHRHPRVVPQPRMPLPWPLPRSLCGPGPYLGPY